MSTFDNDLKDTILNELENAKNEGMPVKDILAFLSNLINYIVNYWL